MDGDPHLAYLAKAGPEVRERLTAIQQAIEQTVPAAQRAAGYGMPAYRQGRIFIYFASFAKHIGVYPPVKAPAELVAELEPYRGPKGNLSFPHADPLPIGLIARVAAALARQYAAEQGAE